MKLEKFNQNRLTKSQLKDTLGGRSKSAIMIPPADPGGLGCEIITIDKNNGTIIQKYRYFYFDNNGDVKYN